MCDTLCALRSGKTLFAKASDRSPGEIQVVEHHAARSGGGRLRADHLEIDDRGAFALVGSRPTGMWGFEHGVNERGVAIGNEQVWTIDDPRDAPPALTGLDLVRLALELGATAAAAVDVLTDALERWGQGGIAEPDAGKAYFSSFLVADASDAWIVETSARSWAARRVPRAERGAALSNRIALSTDFTAASADVQADGDFDRWRRAASPTAHADKRLGVTTPASRDADASPASLVGVLRDHGREPWGRPGGADAAQPWPPPVIDRLGSGVSVCLHLTDVQATTAAMVAELPEVGRPRIWVALGSPCASVFVPAFPFDQVSARVGLAPELSDASTWSRFRQLRDGIDSLRAQDEATDGAALATVRAALDPVEGALWQAADELASAGEDDVHREARARFARGAFAPVDAALHALRV
jgi:hypothetical protein